MMCLFLAVMRCGLAGSRVGSLADECFRLFTRISSPLVHEASSAFSSLTWMECTLSNSVKLGGVADTVESCERWPG